MDKYSMVKPALAFTPMAWKLLLFLRTTVIQHIIYIPLRSCFVMVSSVLILSAGIVVLYSGYRDSFLSKTIFLQIVNYALMVGSQIRCP